MTATMNRQALYNYAPSATYQAQNMFVPNRAQAPAGRPAPIVRPVSAPAPVVRHAPAPVQPRQAPWGATPYTPLQDMSAGYLHRPNLRTSIPTPVIALLSTVITIIAIAIAWWAA